MIWEIQTFVKEDNVINLNPKENRGIDPDLYKDKLVQVIKVDPVTKLPHIVPKEKDWRVGTWWSIGRLTEVINDPKIAITRRETILSE